MPHKINLYHEVLRTRHEVQYDPLRLSMMGLIVIVVGLAGYYAFALAGKSSVQSVLTAKQAQYNDLAAKVKTATVEEEKLNKTLNVGKVLTERIEDRFYWGPVFEQLVSLVPANVQLTRCKGEISQEMPRKVQITIEGLAAGEEPRRVAEDLRVNLLDRLSARYKNVAVTFRNLEDGTDKVTLDGQSLPTATFGMEVNFLPKATPEPTPPPRKASRRLAQQAKAENP